MIQIKCPSCGGELDLPENLDVAQCMYCGTKLVLQDTDVAREKQQLERYTELCNTAFEAKNFQESIEYSNRILEINPTNINAWKTKAISTFWLSTGANNRYDESIEYLRKAKQISPDDPTIDIAIKELNLYQSAWLFELGNDSDETIEAMTYYLQAYDLNPNDLTIIKTIAGLAKNSIKTKNQKWFFG